jgi:general secretion pathway protein G
VPKVLDRLSDAKTGKARADLPAIAQALDQYMISNGRFPDSLEDLVNPDENGRQFLNQKTVPKDPWGAEYEYLPPSGGSNEYDIRTLGRDQQPGGEGEDRDITYAMVRDQLI